MSGLAINGDVVHGVVVGGQAFVPDGNQSLIGKKVSGIKNNRDVLVDDWYESGTTYSSNESYSFNSSGSIDYNYSSTGVIFGVIKILGDTYVAINNSSGVPLAHDSYDSEEQWVSTQLSWIPLKELTIIN